MKKNEAVQINDKFGMESFENFLGIYTDFAKENNWLKCIRNCV